jgi:hypothetical protein
VIAWGERENDPNYVAGAKIRAFESPRRVALAYEYCRATTGQLPYGATMAAEFTIQKTQVGALLRVTHTGIPADAQAYFDSAAEGWRAMLQGIATLLAPKPR